MNLEIFKKNEATIAIQCDQRISRELQRYFSVKAPNYRFAPLFKQGIWDGNIRFFDHNNELPIGLLEKVYEFARLGNYTIKCQFDRFNKIERSEFQRFVKSLNLPFEPRDYQFEAAYQACCKKHLNIHASTAAGKSLIIYIICRFLEIQGLKTLLVCPNVNLVTQMYEDFQSYGMQNVEEKVRQIYAGQTKVFDNPITISTWQSIEPMLKKNNEHGKKILANYNCIMNDEAHLSSGKSLQAISKLAINAEYRFGLSGTYPDQQTADWYSIVGSLGPIQTFATYKTLQENKHIAQIKIYPILLQYSKEFKLKVYEEGQKDYNKENDLIYGYEGRSEFLVKLVQNINENTLVLFTKKEKHGYILRDIFEEKLKGKTILYIDGDIPISERSDIRKMLEERNDIVLLATYGTLSTGFSAKNLHNIVFASSYKSKVKVLQSIGRGLRLHKDKEFLKLYDIVDDVSFKTKEVRFINYSLKHYAERLEYYKKEEWIIKSIKIKI